MRIEGRSPGCMCQSLRPLRLQGPLLDHAATSAEPVAQREAAAALSHGVDPPRPRAAPVRTAAAASRSAAAAHGGLTLR